MQSFIITHYPVPEPVYLKIQDALAHLQPKQRAFVLHVLVGNVLNLGKIRRHDLDGWIDVAIELPCELIADHFGSRFRASDIDPTVLTATPYSTAAHRCKAFVVCDSVLDAFVSWTPASTQEASTVGVVNLFDGKPYRGVTLPEWDHGVYSSPLIRSAVGCFADCPFDGNKLDKHLARLRNDVSGADAKEKDRLERAMRVDLGCAMRIRGGCTMGGTTGYSYHPEYRTSWTGRIIEVGGGAQSCSRAMKAALFASVPDLQNYDLKAAHAAILYQDLEDAGLPRDWTEAYLAEPNAAENRAAALGISKDAYKKCLYATINGAPHRRVYDTRKNKIFHHLVEDCGDVERAKALTGKVYSALSALKIEVSAWHEHLLTSARCVRLDSSRTKVRTLKNACGQHFKLEGYPPEKLRRKAGAFVLQGQEAAFIHQLTLLGNEHGFQPVSNQHDGIVVIGDVPQAAVEEAKRLSGMRYASLAVKAFL